MITQVLFDRIQTEKHYWRCEINGIVFHVHQNNTGLGSGRWKWLAYWRAMKNYRACVKLRLSYYRPEGKP